MPPQKCVGGDDRNLARPVTAQTLRGHSQPAPFIIGREVDLSPGR